jgi:hypothetical protein
MYFHVSTLVHLINFDTLLKHDVSLYAIATALNPKLRVAWFKTQWKRFPTWYKKSEASIRKVYRQYADENEAEEDHVSFEPPTRRKVPSSSRDGFTNAL